MKNTILLFISLLIITLLTGCGNNEIALQVPNYDKENKLIDINGFKIRNVTYHTRKETKPISNLQFVNYISYYNDRYKFDNEICKEITVRLDISRGDKYYIYSKLDDIKTYYSNRCSTKQLYKTNVYFGECTEKKVEKIDNKEKITTIQVYGITQSTRKSQGYGDKLAIGFYSNKECFEEYKNYLLKKYKPKESK
ncbi:hypothetical protein [Arcobacter sp.]|uniref:hypothetical protein n=1 Tax=unclassified Arcobacter TaxID=2593671 RepID=UPI003B00965A